MNLPYDSQIAAWLAAGPDEAPPESLARALAATHRTWKRPRWTFPERWLPVQLTMARTRSQRPIPAIVILVLLMVALVATALVIGSQRREPPPFGPARNGAVVYEQDGDLFIADQLGGTPRSLVAGPETDSDPVFSPQGDRLVFIRDRARIMTVGLDGSDVRELAEPGTVVRLDWSPDASALLASTFSSQDLQALTVVQSSGSGSRTLDLQNVYAIAGSWRPDGQQIAFMGYLAGALAAFIADADGTNVSPLGVGPDDASDGPDWSPTGKQLSFLSSGGITIADIAEDGAMTDVRQLKLDLDPGSTPATDPKWSPDGSQLAFVLRTDFGEASRVGIADADGSGFRFVGPAGSRRGADFTWSPDGRSLIIDIQPPDPGDFKRLARKAWSVDVATGGQTEVGTPAESWQRLAP